MKTKHTPWKWNVTTPNGIHPVMRADDEEQTVIAHVQYKADAALLAMAPELLECLSAMVDLLKHNNGRSTADLNAWAEKGRAAIQKAAGES